jgi:hypothetical protein
MKLTASNVGGIMREDPTGREAPLSRLLTDALVPSMYRLALAADPRVGKRFERVGQQLDRQTDRIVPLLVDLIERELRSHVGPLEL